MKNLLLAAGLFACSLASAQEKTGQTTTPNGAVNDSYRNASNDKTPPVRQNNTNVQSNNSTTTTTYSSGSTNSNSGSSNSSYQGTGQTTTPNGAVNDSYRNSSNEKSSGRASRQ